MAELLGDHGYSTMVLICSLLNTNTAAFETPGYPIPPGDPVPYLFPSDPLFNANLVIQSGSSAGAVNPKVYPQGVAVMSGEHTCLSDRSNREGNLFMYYNGGDSSDAYGPAAGPYMKVVAPNHPIMQGIPLDSEGRVKIYRDPYPEENAHVPVGGYSNVEYDYPVQWATNAAAATTVLGVLDTDTNRSCFAVADIGGILSNGQASPVRMVHYFVCEGGSGSSRRCFNALSDMGRVIFVRAAKWAMGETLQPYVPLGIIKVSQVNPTQIKLAWTGTATKNYKVLATQNLLGPSDFSNWQTVAQDIAGVDGVDATSVKLDISAAPQYAFLRVMPVP